MRKTTIIMLLIIQIILLFFFENIHSFMNILQNKETVMTKDQLLTRARYHVLKSGTDLEVIKSEGEFEYISFARNFRKDPLVEKINDARYYMFDIKSEAGSVLRFREKLDTPFSLTIRKLKGFISAFIILLGIFVLITGIYLVVLFKKGRKIEEPSGLPLLQDYLTKLKESETALKGIVDEQQINIKKSEEISRKVVNRINAAIILMNDKGRIELFNPSAEKMFSKSAAYSLNNTPQNVFTRFPEIMSFIEKKTDLPVSDTINSGNSIFMVELLPISPVGHLAIIRDITEEKKREELINSRKNFMMLGEMTTFLTHEIRNSLGVIYGYTKTIKSDPAKTKKINSEIVFLTEMMENFLNFSKPLSMKRMEPVDMEQIFSDLCSENGITFSATGNPSRTLNTDPNLIRSVFSNLILNAKEAGATAMKAVFRSPGDKLINLEIQDNGNGIKGTDLEKIWYPFFTSKPKGTGMGLALVKKIVNFLNGEITLSDSGESGSSFNLIIYGAEDLL